MHCEHATRLFDAYLDGEISPGQSAELGAHLMHCSDCRRALALLQVSGHLLSSDPEPVALDDGFTDRLMACVQPTQSHWRSKTLWNVYAWGPMAAAAVVALAFMGFFDSRSGQTPRVLAEKNIRVDAPPVRKAPLAPSAETADPATLQRSANNERELSDWLLRMQKNMAAIDQLNLTTLQWIEFLNEAGSRPPAGTGIQENPQALPPPNPNGDVEEL